MQGIRAKGRGPNFLPKGLINKGLNLSSVHAYLHTFANRRRGGIPSLRACTWWKWWAWEVLFHLIKHACIQGAGTI